VLGLAYVDNWREIRRSKQFHRLYCLGVGCQQPRDAHDSRVCIVAVECERVANDVMGRELRAVAEGDELPAGVVPETKEALFEVMV
jgi:hypothetical protein